MRKNMWLTEFVYDKPDRLNKLFTAYALRLTKPRRVYAA